jgi:hypothetical protein
MNWNRREGTYLNEYDVLLPNIKGGSDRQRGHPGVNVEILTGHYLCVL